MPEYDPPASHYTEVNAFINQGDNLKIVGPGGHNFKRLTVKLKLDYLWWNMERNVFEIWGSFDKVKQAKDYLEKYKVRFEDRHFTPETTTQVCIETCQQSKRCRTS